MKKPKPKAPRREYLSEWLARVLKKRGMKTAFAKATGLDRGAVSRSCAGTREIKYEELLAAAKLTGQEIPNLDSDETSAEFTDLAVNSDAAGPGIETVPVVGGVIAGDRVDRIPTNETTLDYVVAPRGSTPHTRALEIRGNSLGEMFDRWLVFFDDVVRPVNPDLLNRLCIVELADDRVLIKRIIRKDGRYDLVSNDGKTIENVQIRRAFRVKCMEPR